MLILDYKLLFLQKKMTIFLGLYYLIKEKKPQKKPFSVVLRT